MSSRAQGIVMALVFSVACVDVMNETRARRLSQRANGSEPARPVLDSVFLPTVRQANSDRDDSSSKC